MLDERGVDFRPGVAQGSKSMWRDRDSADLRFGGGLDQIR